MADLTKRAPLLRFRTDGPFLERFTLDNSAAQEVYYGQPMIIDASADTANLRGWISSITMVTANDKFIGIAYESKSVKTTDVETDNEIEVITRGEVGFKSSTFTDADIGKTVVFTDSATLALGVQAADELEIGTINRVADGYVYIQLNAPSILTFT